MSDEMVIRKTAKRIIDPDRRLDIAPGYVRATELFFDRYGIRFTNEKPTAKDREKGVVVRTIEKWANRSRAAEAADTRRADRLKAKKEFLANEKKFDQEQEEAEEDSASADDEADEVDVDADADSDEASDKENIPAVAKGGKLLPPEKAIWTGAKKLKKKV
jgi:hypothetical protein